MYYNILETDEAIDDITNMAIYYYTQGCSSKTVKGLLADYNTAVNDVISMFPNGFQGIEFEYKGYRIHMMPHSIYNIFFVVNDENKEVYIIRVLHQRQNWSKIIKSNIRYYINGKEVL